MRTAIDRVLVGGAQPDVLHAHWLCPTGWAVVTGPLAESVPVVLSARGSDVHTHPVRSRGIRRLTVDGLRRADVVTAVSRELATQIERLAQTRRPVQVMYNGVDVARYHPAPDQGAVRVRLDLATDRRYWITVCRLLVTKGTRELVAAFASVARAQPDLDLIMVGSGAEEGWIRTELQTMGLGGRVHLVGQVLPEEVPSWLQAADAFVLASYREGLPNAVVEAMATGLPVVATDVGGTAEAMEDGVTGWLVPPRDSDALADAMRRVFDDPARPSQMGAQGRARVESHFDSTVCARRWIPLYESALQPGSADQPVG